MKNSTKNKEESSTKTIAKTAAIAVGCSLVGGAAGAAIGRPSLGVGIVTMVAGAIASEHAEYKQWSLPLLAAGASMSVVYNPNKVEADTEKEGVAGLGSLDAGTAKNRATNFLRSLSRKAYVYKMSPELSDKIEAIGTDESVAGLGNTTTETVFMPAQSPEVSSRQLEDILSRLNTQPTQSLPVSGLGNADIALLGVDRNILLAGIL